MLSSGEKYTDLSYLHTISKGNTSFEQKMLTTFIHQFGTDINKLKEALDDRDWATLFLIAHKMKPSLQFVGLNLLQKDIVMLETLAKQKNDPEKTAEVISVISDVIRQAMEEIKAELIVFSDEC